jgi:organic hydroperoxide reductase OsmC/OhrA
MKSFPHIYNVTASAMPDGDVELTADRLPFLLSAPPAEFGGPGDRWSPETLLAAAVGDCFVLTFRAASSLIPCRRPHTCNPMSSSRERWRETQGV